MPTLLGPKSYLFICFMAFAIFAVAFVRLATANQATNQNERKAIEYDWADEPDSGKALDPVLERSFHDDDEHDDDEHDDEPSHIPFVWKSPKIDYSEDAFDDD